MHVRRIVSFALFVVAALATHAAEEPFAFSPVATVKAFVAALADRDESAVRSYSLPNSKLATLWEKPLSKEEKLSLGRIGKDELRVLKAGENIPMEDGDLIGPREFATESTVLVYGKSMLYPFPVHRVDDAWKVNPGPLLAAREKAKRKK